MQRLHLDQVDDALEARSPRRSEAASTTGFAPSRSRIISTQRKKSAPVLSILLTKTMRGTLYLSACRHTVSVCGSTPALASSSAIGAVEHAQRPLHLDGEVDVAGRVDDVEAALLAVAAFPEGRRRGRRDGDAALLLLLHPVHGGGALMDLAHLVALAGVVEDPLRGRGLPGIDVGHDAEVAVVLDLVFASHGSRLVPGYQR